MNNTKIKQRRFVSYPKTQNFHAIAKEMSKGVFSHYDEENMVPVFKESPPLSFKGTVKLHGTNAGVCMNIDTGEIWAQSRKNIITPLGDNAGFASFVEQKKDIFKNLFEHILLDHNVKKFYSGTIVSLFGEWAGQNIQKGVTISGLDKSLFLFALKFSPIDVDEDEKTAYWVDLSDIQSLNNEYMDSLSNHRIYNIEKFETKSLTIDFQDKVNIQNAAELLTEYTQYCEDKCPVSSQFDLDGVGEGWVWSNFNNGKRLTFKTKGEKHTATKHASKVKITVSPHVMASRIDFIEKYALTESRMKQGIQEVDATSNKQIGDFLKWLNKDILAEEKVSMDENGYIWDDLKGLINQKAVRWFKKNVI